MIDRAVLIMFMIFICMNAADVVTTMIGLQLGAVEADKEMNQLMQYFGVVEALLFKFFIVVFVGLIAVVAHAYSSLDYRLFLVGFAIGIVFYVPIVFRNIQVIRSLLT